MKSGIVYTQRFTIAEPQTRGSAFLCIPRGGMCENLPAEPAVSQGGRATSASLWPLLETFGGRSTGEWRAVLPRRERRASHEARRARLWVGAAANASKKRVKKLK